MTFDAPTAGASDELEIYKVIEMKKEKLDFTKLSEELVERGRDVWLAGLGALSMAEDKGSAFFGSLVERGKDFEEKGRRRVNAAAEEVGSLQEQALGQVGEGVGKVGGTITKLEDKMTAVVDRALAKIDVPSRSEVQDLTGKVDDLAKRVEKLATVLERQPVDQA